MLTQSAHLQLSVLSKGISSRRFFIIHSSVSTQHLNWHSCHRFQHTLLLKHPNRVIENIAVAHFCLECQRQEAVDSVRCHSSCLLEETLFLPDLIHSSISDLRSHQSFSPRYLISDTQDDKPDVSDMQFYIYNHSHSLSQQNVT